MHFFPFVIWAIEKILLRLEETKVQKCVATQADIEVIERGK